MIIKNADVLVNDSFIKTDLVIEGNRITHIGKVNEEGVDYSSFKIIPGFFDIHTHGGNGYDFNTASEEEMEKILIFYLQNGVTSVLPTVMTDDENIIKEQLTKIANLSKKYKMIKGVHLEGPFLSQKYSGAQPKKYLLPLDIEKFNEFQKAANGLIKYITISPELPDAIPFVKELVKQGVKVSLGHSDASFDEASNAVHAGSVSFTHVMNAMKPIDHHNPSIATAALYFDECYNEVIMDGIHVHPEMVNFIKKVKTNDKIIGITDSLMPAGLPNGDYFIGRTPITVYNGNCKIKGTDTRAGSTLRAYQGYWNYILFTKSSEAEASKVWSLNPCKMLSINDSGCIKENYKADLIFILDDEIEKVMIEGEFTH